MSGSFRWLFKTSIPVLQNNRKVEETETKFVSYLIKRFLKKVYMYFKIIETLKKLKEN